MIAEAPGLLGGAGERHYFVAFTNPAEARGLGGFIGAYGEISVNNGHVTLLKTGRAAALNAIGSQKVLSGPADYLRRYGQFQPAENFEDLTYSPDFPTDASVISQLYSQSGGDSVDGVLELDPSALATVLQLTGPVSVEGLSQVLDAQNAATFLIQSQYFQYGDGVVEAQTRHDVLQAVASAAFTRFTTTRLPPPQAVASLLGPDVSQGHFLFWSNHPTEQPLLRELGLAGAFPNAKGGDLLAVTTQNASNNKDDAYLTRRVDDRVRFNPQTGQIEATVTVALHNGVPPGAPSSFSTSYVGSGLPPATDRIWITLYSPLAVVGAKAGGESAGVSAIPELGVIAYSEYVNVLDGQTANLTFELSGRVHPSDAYSIALRQQPAASPPITSIEVSGTNGWRIVGAGIMQGGAAMVSHRRLVLTEGS